ncbi:MAG: class I SAM-dependent methyltransferase [Granulosicoccus sp.]
MQLNTHDLGISSDKDVIAQFLQIDGLFLVDAGCGDMSFSRELASRGASVLAIDPDPVQSEKNRQAETIPNVGFVQAGAQQIPVEPDSIDGVVFRYSLHHVPLAMHEAVFHELRRVLKPGGFLFIMEPVAIGPLNDIMSIFHDEKKVREQAQKSMEVYGMPAFAQSDIISYRVPVQFSSWEQFADTYASKSFNSDYSEAEVRAEAVRERFMALGTPLNFRFETSVRISYLSGHLESVSV